MIISASRDGPQCARGSKRVFANLRAPGDDTRTAEYQSLVRRRLSTAADAVEGEEQTFIVQIEAHQRPGRAGHPWKIRTFDGTGFISLIFFRGRGPRLAARLELPRRPRPRWRILSPSVIPDVRRPGVFGLVEKPPTVRVRSRGRHVAASLSYSPTPFPGVRE